ncbi:ABC transporter substrate-binding protein [Nakamurella aerolata]|uniref:ABC transporter substrate-binding protein n=1 Tax=Nakamurella aerolata TaxID=1656892 RepID=A0A849ABW2_9ACTN|nr:ABC transporter substrate-binding protein [Nakamurella aerolata]NNG37417.1 ABC transporter substrate-binding protein [Nakamurella aerolata]
MFARSHLSPSVRFRRGPVALVALVALAVVLAGCGSAPTPAAGSSGSSGISTSGSSTSGSGASGSGPDGAGPATEPAGGAAGSGAASSGAASSGAPSSAGASGAPSGAGASGAAGNYRPVTVNNCGFSETFTAPPQRVVVIKSTSLEMLLALGLGDRIVGTAFLDGPVPPEQRAAAERIPQLAQQVPGREALLGATPDLVYAGWESNLTDQGAGNREGLLADGVRSYVSPAACKNKKYQPDPLTFDTVNNEIRELAAIFGVPERAEALIAKNTATLAAVKKKVAARSGPAPRVLWYSSGSDQPYVGAGIGAPAMIMRELGWQNIFADVSDTWASVSWEQVVAADPQLIVLVDATWNTAAKKKAQLAAGPAKDVDAVRNQRYLTVRFPATEAGVANVEAVSTLAEQWQQLP